MSDDETIKEPTNCIPNAKHVDSKKPKTYRSAKPNNNDITSVIKSDRTMII